MDIDLLLVLAAYPDLADRSTIWPIEGAGGFSGARLWRISTPRGDFAVRCWPVEHPNRERLSWIHAVLKHVFLRGFLRVAVPRRNQQAATILSHGGHLWEAAPWLPGTADYARQPRLERLQAAARTLAEFHQAAASFEPDPSRQPAPGILSRNQQLRQWASGRLDELSSAVQASTGDDEVTHLARQILACVPAVLPVVAASMTSSMLVRLALQPCLRDIWSAHVLFEGDRVTGFIDYGAMQLDCVATDIARLLGSLVGDDAAGWAVGLEAYQSERPLSPAERSLIAAYDSSAALLAPLNWLQWLFLERRRFDQPDAVLDRLRECTARLQHLTLRLGDNLHFPAHRGNP